MMIFVSAIEFVYVVIIVGIVLISIFSAIAFLYDRHKHADYDRKKSKKCPAPNQFDKAYGCVGKKTSILLKTGEIIEGNVGDVTSKKVTLLPNDVTQSQTTISLKDIQIIEKIDE